MWTGFHYFCILRWGKVPEPGDYSHAERSLGKRLMNKQTKLMADNLLCEILCEIRCTKLFSIQADKVSDVACIEQICVTIHWVSQDFDTRRSHWPFSAGENRCSN